MLELICADTAQRTCALRARRVRHLQVEKARGQGAHGAER